MTKTSKQQKSAVRAAITGVHCYVPPDVLTNAELARMVDTTDQWIVERTGIKERHILKGKGLGTSHMGAEAVRGLLEDRHRTGRRRSSDLRHDDARLRVSLDRQSHLRHGGYSQHRQLRRAGRVLRLCLRAHHLPRSSSSEAPVARSWSSAPTRCRRSSTIPTGPPACCSATAPARCSSSRTKSTASSTR